MAVGRLSGLIGVCAVLATACAADDSDVGGVGGTSGFGGVVSGGSGGTGAGGSGGQTGGSGGQTGGAAGTGGVAGSAGSGGATGGTGGTTTGGTGGTTTGGTGGTTTGGSGGTTTGGAGGTTGGTGGTTTGGTGGTATGGTGGTTGDTTPPTVTSTTPAPNTKSVTKNSTIVVTFSEPMQVASITASTSGTSCSGAIQVSADDFSSCVAMSGNPVASGGNSAFTLTPASNLLSLGNYKVRVTTAAKDASGNALAAVYSTPTAFTVRYFHTITIDGNNDFLAGETFATSSAGYTAYVAWDDNYVYIGMKGADVQAASATKWFFAYFSGSPGSTAGVTYNTQQPTLPFSSRWHARWRTNNTFTDAQAWSGSAWAAASWNFTGDVYQTGTFIEMRIPQLDIGSPSILSLHLGMLNEQGGSEATYAAVPSTSFSDGYDPNYAKYLELDFSASVMPNASPVKP
ncbi:MAG: Ig-like domain-containing protein [Myxococcales bacterium]|nr:Ig-like domain-containing protein [Myxococcales bacterium]